MRGSNTAVSSEKYINSLESTLLLSSQRNGILISFATKGYSFTVTTVGPTRYKNLLHVPWSTAPPLHISAGSNSVWTRFGSFCWGAPRLILPSPSRGSLGYYHSRAPHWLLDDFRHACKQQCPLESVVVPI